MQNSYRSSESQPNGRALLRLLAAATLILSLALAPLVRAGNSGGGEPSATAVELQRRLEMRDRAQQLISAGDTLAAEGKGCDAAENYRQAAQLLRQGVMATRELRAEALRKFTATAVPCVRELADGGEYDKANQLLDQVLAQDMAPDNAKALALKEHLKDPDYFNPALTPAHVADVDKVRRMLRNGEALVALGDYNSARASYNQVLAIDSTNTAARRGMEHVERLITEHLKSERDYTRLKMLNEVDRIWEQGVPSLAGVRPAGTGVSDEIPITGGSAASKLRTIVIPRLQLTDAPVSEALSYLAKKSAELDLAEPDENKRGVNIVWHPGAGGESAAKTITVDLRNVRLGDALRAVCESSGTRFRVDGGVVTVSASGGSVLETRQFKVPPGFLSSAAASVATDTAAADPFAPGGATETRSKLGRMDARGFLEKQGVAFPEGAGAAYNPAQNLLTVTNTPENLEIISAMVEGLTASGQKQALIQAVLLKTSERTLTEMGGDALLESFKIGGGLFGSGGTFGSSEFGSPGNSAFLPIEVPFNVVRGPITAGNRSTFDLNRNQTIDDLINLAKPGGASAVQGRSPSIGSFAGPFTSPRFQTLLRALNQKKGVDLSVANTVIVKSGQRASSFSGRKFFYPTEFDPPQIPQTVVAPQIIIFDPTTGFIAVITLPLATVPVTPATPTSFQEKDIGSTLEVEATIGEDGYTVELNLSLVFSEFDGFINYGTPIRGGDPPAVLTENRIIQPVFSKTSVNTLATVYDGQTVAVGGLTEAKTETIQDKTPILSSIPIIGKFFKSDLERNSRTAIIYFVTVKIVDPSGNSVTAAGRAAEAAAGGLPGMSTIPR